MARVKKEPSKKCYQCKKVIKDEFVEEYVGSKLMYLHTGECHEKLLQRKKDTEDFDYLTRYIKDIYNEQDLEMPTGFCSHLYDVRNGAIRFLKGGVVDSKSMKKEGVPFDILIEAFQLAEKDIKRTLTTKMFVNRTAKYNYGLAIAKNKIQAVLARRKLQEQRDRVVENVEKIVVEEEIVAYKDRVRKPDKPKDDISELFE